ncbi:MAG TPA: phospholipase D-like domain-containing protein, partial [Acidimicrobiales bacterium]
MSEHSDGLTEGLYEALITRRLAAALATLDRSEPARFTADRRKVEPADADTVVAHHLVPLLRRAIASQPADRRVTAAVSLANDIVALLAGHAARAVDADADAVAGVAELLLAVAPAAALPGQASMPPRPTAPLSASDLLTNARGEPSIGHEIALELASADRVDLICAFIRWSGIRQLLHPIRRLAGAGKHVRIFTTTYLGATQRRALDELVRAGAQVKVSYDDDNTRLHAKAWLFHRATGFTTAYVGSSNLSATAQHHGLEWNVRMSAVGNPELLGKIEASFENYWASPQFEDYLPDRDGDRFDAAIARARGEQRPAEGDGLGDVAFLDVTPKPFQARILEEL